MARDRDIIDFSELLWKKKFWIFIAMICASGLMFIKHKTNGESFRASFMFRVEVDNRFDSIPSKGYHPDSIFRGVYFDEIRFLKKKYETSGFKFKAIKNRYDATNGQYVNLKLGKDFSSQDKAEDFLKNSEGILEAQTLLESYFKMGFENLYKHKLKLEEKRLNFELQRLVSLSGNKAKKYTVPVKSVEFGMYHDKEIPLVHLTHLQLGSFINKIRLRIKALKNLNEALLHNEINKIFKVSTFGENDFIKIMGKEFFGEYKAFYDYGIEARINSIYVLDEPSVIRKDRKTTKKMMLAAVAALFISIMLILVFSTIKAQAKD